MTQVVLSNHSLRHSGGMERYLLTLIRGMHARGIRPTVAAKRFDTRLEEYGWIDPCAASMLGVPGKLQDAWFDRKLRALKARHGWFPLVALNLTAAADIAVCGGNHPGFLEAMGRRTRWSDRMKIRLERAHFEHARTIVAHSRLMAREIQGHYGIPAAKIELAYPPIDTARFSTVGDEERLALRERFGLPRDRAAFLLASTGHSRKGLDLALQALGSTDRPAVLVVAGRPTRERAPNLLHVGYRQDIEDLYRAVDCTLLPSRYEPFGLVSIESVLCGTPVIAADEAGCVEVMRPPAVLPFRLDDPASFDAAIDTVLSRWRDDSLRIADPAATLDYDPSVDRHVSQLLGWIDALRRSR